MTDPRFEKLLEHCRAGRETMEEMITDMREGRSKVGIGDGVGPNDRTEEAIAFYSGKMEGLSRLISEIEARNA